jgi:4-hydroxybenzoyl-CoA thioesterase
MKFERQQTVRFAHCDPAGIVYFPQYLVMLTSLVEAWFDRGLRIPYADLVMRRRVGLPTVRLQVDFTAVSRLGDELTQSLAVAHVGHSSLHLHTEFHGRPPGAPAHAEAELRMRCKQVLVCTSLDDHRPRPLPDDIRVALPPYLTEPPK